MDELKIKIERYNNTLKEMTIGDYILTDIEYQGWPICIRVSDKNTCAYRYEDKEFYVILNVKDCRSEFVLTHEIGHILLDHINNDEAFLIANAYNTNHILWAINPIEVEADAFAYILLGKCNITEGRRIIDSPSVIVYLLTMNIRKRVVELYLSNPNIVRAIYKLLNKLVFKINGYHRLFFFSIIRIFKYLKNILYMRYNKKY